MCDFKDGKEKRMLEATAYSSFQHVIFLLDSFDLWEADGTFTFPDGDIYRKEMKR